MAKKSQNSGKWGENKQNKMAEKSTKTGKKINKNLKKIAK